MQRYYFILYLQTMHYKNSLFFFIFASELIFIIIVKLHIFNPEHDIALAYDKHYLVVPHAAKELRMNLGFIPSLWADEGDCVLVDDVQYAVKASTRLGICKSDVLFLSLEQLRGVVFDDIVPWGWDRCLVTQLKNAGVVPSLLPSEEYLRYIRFLSSRERTIEALDFIRGGIETKTCGKSFYCTAIDEFYGLMNSLGDVVVKAPWSSSGRGLRYVHGVCSSSTLGWIKRTMANQGGVMVEPYYNKVKDFGLEFYSNGNGTVEYCGMSLFETVNGSYTGSIVSEETQKLKVLGEFVSEELINIIKQRCIKYFGTLFRNNYKGPFGVDMMIVARNDMNGFTVHPCVEINLRRTMGHIALSLFPLIGGSSCIMRVVHDVNYHIRLTPLDKCFVKTL